MGIVEVTVGVVWCISFGSLINQWSRGVLVGVYVVVRGSPRCWSCVFVMKSARGS